MLPLYTYNSREIHTIMTIPSKLVDLKKVKPGDTLVLVEDYVRFTLVTVKRTTATQILINVPQGSRSPYRYYKLSGNAVGYSYGSPDRPAPTIFRHIPEMDYFVEASNKLKTLELLHAD